MLINITVEITIDKYKHIKNSWENIEEMDCYDLEQTVKWLYQTVASNIYWSKILAEIKKEKEQAERR